MQRVDQIRSRRVAGLSRLMRAASAAAILTVMPIASHAQQAPAYHAQMVGPSFQQKVGPDKAGPDKTGPDKAGPVRRSWLSPRIAEEERIAGLLYVSYADSGVLIFTRTVPNQLLGELYEGLCLNQGIAVDSKNRLYVGNLFYLCSGPSVTIFHPGVAAPSTVITDGMYYPQSVTVSAKDGTVYVMDVAGDSILEYAGGKTRVKNIVYRLGGRPFAIALDRNDVLHALFYDDRSGKFAVSRYDTTSRKFVDLGIEIASQGQIVFDTANNMLISNLRLGVISAYAPGSKTPFRTYRVAGSVDSMTLDRESSVLYVCDNDERTVEEISYPSGRKLGTIGGFEVNTFGVAATSPLRQGNQ